MNPIGSSENRIQELNECIKEHLDCTTPQWSDACELRESSEFGCGLFAIRDIEPDEILFCDKALMLGPSGNQHEPMCCVVCYKLLESDITSKMCRNECGLILCESQNCSENHQNECKLFREWQPKNPIQISFRRLKALFVIRGLFLRDSQKHFFALLQKNYTNLKKDIFFADEFDNFPTENAILDELRASSAAVHTNAFMLLYRIIDSVHVNVRGFYPVLSLLNHNCVPNSRHDIDNNFRYKIAATKPIKKDEQIFNSYTQLLWATNSRRLQILISKQFLCICSRCMDPNEHGTNLSAIRCQNTNCPGIVLPIQPLDFRSDAKCTRCEQLCESKRFLRIHEVVAAMCKNWLATTIDLAAIVQLMETRLSVIVPACSQYVVEMKLNAIWKYAAESFEGRFYAKGNRAKATVWPLIKCEAKERELKG